MMSEQFWGLSEFRDVAAGAAILGSGGGGGYKDALFIISQLASLRGWSGTVTVKPYDGCSPASVIAMMGSPDAAGEMSLDELSRSIGNTLSVQSAICGFKPSCAIPIEIGPINSLVPLLAAALQLGDIRWVVDGDGAGRAVPELPQTTYAGAAALPPTPCVVADNATQPGQIQSGVIATPTTAQVETLAGAVVKAFGAFAGISMWPSSQANGFALSGQYIPGTLEQIRALGKFLQTRPATDAVARQISMLTGRAAEAIASNYYITQVSQATSAASLDAGILRLDNDPDPAKSTHHFTLYNLNENLIAYSSSQAAPVILAPDSICYYSEDDAAGFSNATDDLAAYYDFSRNCSSGKKVSVIKVVAVPQLAATPGVLASFANLLRSIGYAGALPY
jgi:DUF917 family protein